MLTKVSEIEEKEARISREKDEDNEKFKAEIAEIKEQFSKEIEKYQNKVDDLQGQVNASRDENATITANEKVLNGQLRVLRDEKNTLEYELKKTIQQNSDLEKELKDLRVSHLLKLLYQIAFFELPKIRHAVKWVKTFNLIVFNFQLFCIKKLPSSLFLIV